MCIINAEKKKKTVRCILIYLKKKLMYEKCLEVLRRIIDLLILSFVRM